MKNLVFVLITIALFSCKKTITVEHPLPSETLTDISYGTDPAQKMDIYLPAGRSSDSTKIMVLVHGGGWNAGDKSEFTSYLASFQLKFSNYAIANINYRLATITTNHFPTQENDMKTAVDYLVEKSGHYHFAQKIVLVGTSAGAHMALLQAYKYSSPKVKAVVDFFGPTDITDLHNFYAPGSLNQNAIQILMNGNPNTNSVLYERSSPINYVTSQSSPTIIFHGAMDNVVPIRESIALSNKLNSIGVANELIRYPNVGHEVWSLPIMNDAFTKIDSFLKANVK
jgi:acetyl esterase/lipase